MSDTVVQQEVKHTRWKQYTNSVEDQRLSVIERRIDFKKKTLRELNAEKRRITMRAIRRMRRAEGKE